MFDGVPYSYSESNIFSAMANPTAVQTNSAITEYFRRYLLQKAMSVSRWTLPANWDHRYFLYALHVIGNVAVIKTDRFGVIPQHCTLKGRNVQYMPSQAVITNPLIDTTVDAIIGKNCTLFTMTSDFGGILDMVNYYASLLAMISESFASNTFNSRLAYMFAAKNSNIAESMKKAADKILSGQPYVVTDKALFNTDGTPAMTLFLNNLSQNFIAPEQMQLMQMVENHFDVDFGLPATYPSKSERMLTSEVENMRVERSARYGMWLDGWKRSCEETRKMFGVDISVELREGTPNE